MILSEYTKNKSATTNSCRVLAKTSPSAALHTIIIIVHVHVKSTTGTCSAKCIVHERHGSCWTRKREIKPSSHSTGRDGTRRKDRREATGRSDGVQCEHQERERNRTIVQIGKRREELVDPTFHTVDGRRRGRKRTKRLQLECEQET